MCSSSSWDPKTAWSPYNPLLQRPPLRDQILKMLPLLFVKWNPRGRVARPRRLWCGVIFCHLGLGFGAVVAASMWLLNSTLIAPNFARERVSRNGFTKVGFCGESFSCRDVDNLVSQEWPRHGPGPIVAWKAESVANQRAERTLIQLESHLQCIHWEYEVQLDQ